MKATLKSKQEVIGYLRMRRIRAPYIQVDSVPLADSYEWNSNLKETPNRSWAVSRVDRTTIIQGTKEGTLRPGGGSSELLR